MVLKARSRKKRSAPCWIKPAREEELKAQQALALMQEEKYADALPLLKEAWQLSNQESQIGLLLAETLIALHRSDEAESVLKTIPLQDQDTHYQGLVAQIELLKQAADTPEIQQLQQQVEQNPGGCAVGLPAGAAAASGRA